MTVGERIRFCRKAIGLNQTELAEIINVNRSCIWWIEDKNRLPQVLNLFKISRALNVSMDYLMTGQEFCEDDKDDGWILMTGEEFREGKNDDSL